MADPFLGEIKMFSFDWAPQGWALCNGQFLPINQNQALFSLLGTTYGGNGQTTFALPNLRGRTPIHFDQSHPLGQAAGTETHTLTQNEMPTHTHTVRGSSGAADNASPSGNFSAANAGAYRLTSNASMSAQGITSVGGSQPHENRSPYLVISFCIALQGIFPSRNIRG
jgi:microcystin-dependent protein